MSSPRASFTTLPDELYTLIIIQASLQDEVYRRKSVSEGAEEDLPMSRERREEPYAFIRFNKLKGYGQSVLALYSTCKLLRALAMPFAFKVLHLSKTLSTDFQTEILPTYAHSFTTLVLDGLHHSPELSDDEEDLTDDSMSSFHSDRYGRKAHRVEDAVEDFLSTALPHLSSLRRIEIPSNSDYSSVHLLERLPELATMPESSNSKKKRTQAKIFKAIARSITSVKIDNLVRVSLPDAFKNLTEVSLSVSSAEFYVGCEIPALKRLTSLAVHLASLFLSGGGCYLPVQWRESVWKSQGRLQSLALDLPALSNSEWRFLSKFENSISSLSLTFRAWKVGNESEAMVFPRLDSLTLKAKKEDMIKALAWFSRHPTLRTLNLVVTPSTTGPQDLNPLYASVKTLHTAKITLRIQLSEYIQQATQDAFVNFTTSTTFAAASLTSLAPWKNYIKDTEHTQLIQGGMEPVKMESLALRSLLLKVQEKIEQAERVGDMSALEEWGRWMSPLTGKTVLDLQ